MLTFLWGIPCCNCEWNCDWNCGCILNCAGVCPPVELVRVVCTSTAGRRRWGKVLRYFLRMGIQNLTTLLSSSFVVNSFLNWKKRSWLIVMFWFTLVFMKVARRGELDIILSFLLWKHDYHHKGQRHSYQEDNYTYWGWGTSTANPCKNTENS